MIQTLELDEVWDRLNDAFLGVYEEVLRNTATVRWQVHHSDNSYFCCERPRRFSAWDVPTRRISCCPWTSIGMVT